MRGASVWKDKLEEIEKQISKADQFELQVQELKNEIGAKARIIKVDIDKNPGAAQKYQVKGVPTFILFKDGNPVWRQSGAIPKLMLTNAIKSVS